MNHFGSRETSSRSVDLKTGWRFLMQPGKQKNVLKGSLSFRERFGLELLTVKPGSIPDPDQENMKHFRQFRDIRSDEKRVSRHVVCKDPEKIRF